MKFLSHFKGNNLLYWSLEVLIIVCIIFVLSNLTFIYQPLITFCSTLFTPILIAGFLFYILNPIVKFLEKKIKIKRIWSIIIVFFLLIAIIIFIILNFIPNLVEQILSLAKNVPAYIRNVQKWLLQLNKYPLFKNIDFNDTIKKFDLSYSAILTKTLNGAANSLTSIFSAVTSIIITLVTVPFVLFYMLKDGNNMKDGFLNLFTEKKQSNIANLLEQMNHTIAAYIGGQAIECLFVGTCMIIGYFFLGIEYAFLFGIFSGLTNLIPYLGPYIGLAPAFLTTVFASPLKGFLCIVLVIIVQQIDGNIIYPNVIGKNLQIHPLTIIFVLLVAGNLAGLIGIFLGVPIYAISKTVLKFLTTIYKKQSTNDKYIQRKEP